MPFFVPPSLISEHTSFLLETKILSHILRQMIWHIKVQFITQNKKEYCQLCIYHFTNISQAVLSPGLKLEIFLHTSAGATAGMLHPLMLKNGSGFILSLTNGVALMN